MKTTLADRGDGFHFRYSVQVVDDTLGTYYIGDLSDDMKVWMESHVGQYRDAYTLIGDSILFRRFEDAFAFRLRWA